MSTDVVKFKLNGREVAAPKGTTVMQVCEREGVNLPHFCWHPGLSIAGVCRFCMVDVTGRPKLEIGCNLPVAEGMEVSTESAKAKEAHKWALEFHLINHPLDCPICDQAGECGLQDYYMEVGKYQSQMTRPKVLKPKALEVGGDLVLDTERCILCSRCVRFEEEVTKTGALGIFDRGDRSIIGTYPGKKITHNYTDNLVDICPVGAFTSKAFRFKQRVWFLKDKPATCPGCATGCQTNVYAKPEVRKFFRLKPRSAEQNGHWMCDVGRGMYTHLNRENRLAYAKADGKAVPTAEALRHLATALRGLKGSEIGLLVSAQYTVEEYRDLFAFFGTKLGVKSVFQWREPTEKIAEFDGLLYRGDHNSNTAGLIQALKAHGFDGKVENQFDAVPKAGLKLIVALVPEVPSTFPSLDAQLKSLSELSTVSAWGLNYKIDGLPFKSVVPLKGFAEKSGTFLNFEGKEGKLEANFPSPVREAMDVSEVVAQLAKFMTDGKEG